MSSRKAGEPYVDEVFDTSDKENFWDGKPSQLQKSRPSSCVFVASLCASMRDDELCRSVSEKFKAYGAVTSVKVLRDTFNRPYAFVQYTNDDDCQKAIHLGHNSELNGRKLRCEAAKVNRTLFVAATQPLFASEIRDLVAKYGDIDSILPSSSSGHVLPLESETLALSNWYIKFAYRPDAIRAFANTCELPNLYIEWAQNVDREHPEALKFDKFSVYVGNLPMNAKEEAVKQRFLIHGSIKSLSIVRNHASRSAFVTYEDEASAASAVGTENHTLFLSRTIHVQYRDSVSKRAVKPISPIAPLALAPPPINLRRPQMTPKPARYAARWAHPLVLVPQHPNTRRDYLSKENRPKEKKGWGGYGERKTQRVTEEEVEDEPRYYLVPEIASDTSE